MFEISQIVADDTDLSLSNTRTRVTRSHRTSGPNHPKTSTTPSIEAPSFTCFLVRHAITDMIDAFEGGNSFLIAGNNNDGGFELARHDVLDVGDGDSQLETPASIGSSAMLPVTSRNGITYDA